MLWMEDNEINGDALAALWDACFDRADAFTLCRAVWTHATNDALRQELEPYRVRSFHTVRWFCHMSTEPFLEVSEYRANADTRRIVKQHVTELYFGISRNRDLHTLEDICFFRKGSLFFGSVSHEGFCAALPDTQDFEKMLWNIGMWPKEEDPLVRIELPDYGEEREP